jgi:hypothetical protein
VIFADSVVDVHDLLEVAWVSLVASVILVVAVSLSILGAARSAAERRDGNGTAATLYAGLSVIGAAICVGGVVLAVSVMLSKG